MPEPNRDFRLAEAGAFGRNGKVAGQRHFKSAGQREAVHGRDGRLRAVPELHQEIEVEAEDLAPLVDVSDRVLGRFLHVEAGRKGAAVPMQDDRVDLGIRDK